MGLDAVLFHRLLPDRNTDYPAIGRRTGQAEGEPMSDQANKAVRSFFADDWRHGAPTAGSGTGPPKTSAS